MAGNSRTGWLEEVKVVNNPGRRCWGELNWSCKSWVPQEMPDGDSLLGPCRCRSDADCRYADNNAGGCLHRGKQFASHHIRMVVAEQSSQWESSTCNLRAQT